MQGGWRSGQVSALQDQLLHVQSHVGMCGTRPPPKLAIEHSRSLLSNHPWGPGSLGKQRHS